MTYLLFAIGLGLLIVGAEALVRGASRLAAAVGITPLVIGLTVVALGTSSPELTVSVLAAYKGAASANVAVGNVIGSNILNVLLILGLSAVVAPLVVAQKLVRIDVPIMIALSFAILFVGRDGTITRLEAMVLVAALIGYVIFAIRQGREEEPAIYTEYEEAFADRTPPHGKLRDVALIVAGLVMLVLGSRWLVNGAVEIASRFGVSDLVISLTIIAAGTSLPEIATSVLASMKGERDIAVGNVVGSNIFNLLAVLGITGVVAPAGVNVPSAALTFDLPVMIATAIICLPIFFTGYLISRYEALLFLGYYGAYVAYVILAANEHDALPAFSRVMLFYTVPATVLILGIAVVRQLRRNRTA
jgi:cation:H+ antiporter